MELVKVRRRPRKLMDEGKVIPFSSEDPNVRVTNSIFDLNKKYRIARKDWSTLADIIEASLIAFAHKLEREERIKRFSKMPEEM